MSNPSHDESQFYWPNNEPRIHAVITDITPAAHLRGWCCVTFSMNNRPDQHFNPITMEVPEVIARNYRIGGIYAAHFKLLGSMI